MASDRPHVGNATTLVMPDAAAGPSIQIHGNEHYWLPLRVLRS
jgi:hypothetical protein